MNIQNSFGGKSCKISVWAAVVAAGVVFLAATAGYAQPPDAAWQNLQEIVKFTQAHMSDDVIVSFIKSSGKTYIVSADGLLYLNSQGVSQPVLAALLAASAPGAAVAPPPPQPVMTAPPETPTIDYFQAHLTPYGQWVDVPGVGAAWVPAEANIPGWRPYMNAGHWQFTDAGWFWQSDYAWGDMAFHYGRWVNNEFTGGRWAWVPGYDWAPSWVSWREGAGGLGWAPLPWGVEFHVGVGLFWHGALVVDGVGFGLGFDAFVFVGPDHFWGGDYNRYAFDRVRAREFYEHSEFHAGYRVVGGRVTFEGLGREHMAAITHHEVVEHKAAELRHTEESQHFAKRTEEHKELAHVPVHGKEPARAEANHGAAPNRATEAHGAANEHGAAAHTPEAHSTVPATARETHPGATAAAHAPETHSTVPAHPGTTEPHPAVTTHSPETHSTVPGSASSTHPGAPGSTSNSKLPPPKPRAGGTNQPAR